MMHTLVTTWFHWVENWGYAGVFILMALESSIVPVPSELVMPPAAFWAAQGRMSFSGVVLAGTLGSLFGSVLNYGAARALGLPILKKYGRWVLLSPDKIQFAETLVKEHGVVGVFVSRLLPVVRHLISIPAGALRMPFLSFSVVTTLGAGIWCWILAWFGQRVLGARPELLSSPEQMIGVIKGELMGFVLAVVGFVVLYALMLFLKARARRRLGDGRGASSKNASGLILLVLGMGLVAAGMTATPLQAAPRGVASPEAAEVRGSGGASSESPIFHYTHLLPSPFTLPGGRLVLGTEVAFGLTDFLQVGTNALRLAYGYLNANAKLSVLEFDEFATALTFNYERFNPRDFSARNPDITIQQYQPGMVTAFRLHPRLAWFVGGTLNFTQYKYGSGLTETSGYLRGASIGSDLSWAYNPKRRSMGNVLSGGVSYDVTFKLFGVGVSHHWSGFHVGFHYYPNATDRKWLPIIAGGAAVDL